MSKLRFAYLYYTAGILGGGPHLLGVFASVKAARTHFDLVDGVYVESNSPRRVLQKQARQGPQFWYVEKHVMKDPI